MFMCVVNLKSVNKLDLTWKQSFLITGMKGALSPFSYLVWNILLFYGIAIIAINNCNQIFNIKHASNLKERLDRQFALQPDKEKVAWWWRAWTSKYLKKSISCDVKRYSSQLKCSLLKISFLKQLCRQGILQGEVSLYHWPPVWLVWNQPYDNWQFFFLFAKQTNPNQSNRRSTVQ